LRRAGHPSKESYRLCKIDYETEEEAKAQQRAVEPLKNEWVDESYVSLDITSSVGTGVGHNEDGDIVGEDIVKFI
jgi:hypothetical protein